MLSTAIILASAQAYGAGFQITYQSAEGIGRANSGEGAIGNSAAAGARNPAALSLLDNAGVSGGLTFVRPQVDISGSLTTGQTFNHESVAQDGLVPNFHYASPLNESLAVGVSLGSFYGTTTEFPSDSPAGAQTGETSLTTINANLYGAYKVNQAISVGAGVNYVKADAKMVRTAGVLANGINVQIPGLGATATTKIVEVEGDANGFGWNVGALWQLNDSNRFAVSYRSRVDLTFDGDFKGLSSNLQPTNAELKIELPELIELSGYHQLNQALAVHYTAALTGWDSFQELRATSTGCQDGICLQKDEKWEDSWKYSVGLTYGVSDMLTIRGGIALDQSPVQQEYRTMSIPDADRMRYSLGATVGLSSQFTIDAGMAYVDSDAEQGEEVLTSSNPALKASFMSESTALIFALQANYNF